MVSCDRAGEMSPVLRTASMAAASSFLIMVWDLLWVLTCMITDKLAGFLPLLELGPGLRVRGVEAEDGAAFLHPRLHPVLEHRLAGAFLGDLVGDVRGDHH